MSQDITKHVIQTLTIAEAEYEKQNVELRGFEKVLKVLEKLEKVRARKIEDHEDVEGLDRLRQECDEKLCEIIESADINHPFNIDFQKWAYELETDLRAEDPYMLSFSSSGDEGNVSSSRVRSRRESHSSKGINSLLNILKSNGRINSSKDENDFQGDRHFAFVTTMAWLLAVAGMTVTIGFLAADFYKAQRDVAIHMERTAPTSLELPAITICNNVPNLPGFAHFPSGDYAGLPLFGITAYMRTRRNESEKDELTKFPDIMAGFPYSPVEKVMVGESPSCLNASVGFDVNREMRTLHAVRTVGSLQQFSAAGGGCLHCFRIGFKRRELLQPYSTNDTTDSFTPAVEIRVFRSRLLHMCTSPSYKVLVEVGPSLISELIKYGTELENKGILNFNGAPYDVLKFQLKGLKWRKQNDFYCNIAFFSGVFYPSTDKANISYAYNANVTQKWVQTGTGPYYSSYAWEEGAPRIQGPSAKALLTDTHALTGLLLYAEEAALVNTTLPVSPKTNIGILGEQQDTIYTFTKVSEGGKAEYRVKENSVLTSRVVDQPVSLYYLGFDFRTFETVTISTVPTMQWSEFVTDVFEFIGLFTGICIFTLIVAPVHSIGLGEQPDTKEKEKKKKTRAGRKSNAGNQ